MPIVRARDAKNTVFTGNHKTYGFISSYGGPGLIPVTYTDAVGRWMADSWDCPIVTCEGCYMQMLKVNDEMLRNDSDEWWLCVDCHAEDSE